MDPNVIITRDALVKLLFLASSNYHDHAMKLFKENRKEDIRDYCWEKADDYRELQRRVEDGTIADVSIAGALKKVTLTK